MIKIGKVYPTYMHYFDRVKKIECIKSRPALIIGEPKGLDCEYAVLPISTITQKRFFDPQYDIPIIPQNYPKLYFHHLCYVRSHKQTIVYKSRIDFQHCVGDIKNDYPKLYDKIITSMQMFDSLKIFDMQIKTTIIKK